MLRPVAKYVNAVHSHLLSAAALQPPPIPPLVPAGGPVARRIPIPRPPLPVGSTHYVTDATFRILRILPMHRTISDTSDSDTSDSDD